MTSLQPMSEVVEKLRMILSEGSGVWIGSIYRIAERQAKKDASTQYKRLKIVHN